MTTLLVKNTLGTYNGRIELKLCIDNLDRKQEEELKKIRKKRNDTPLKSGTI